MQPRRLAVVLFTAATSPERAQYAYTTLHSTLDLLKYSGPLKVHIADDGSSDEHRAMLQEIAGGYASIESVTTTNAERGGYGHSYNLASQVVHAIADVTLMVEDDWELRAPLDADQFVEAFGGTIDCIRLGYLGWTQALRGELVGRAGRTYWLLDPGSPERHVFAGHPRIETVQFERRVGEWPVGLDAGTTEFEVAGRMTSRLGVAWPDGWSGYHHIGTVQARTDQREAVANV